MKRHLLSASSAALVAALTLSLLAAPVSAGGASATLWVDDDGHAGPNRCGGSATAFTSVQAAVDASDLADRVKVCPGRYLGQVLVAGASHDGLVLEAVRTHEARLVTRRTHPDGGNLVDIIGSDHVRVLGFMLVARTSQPCGRVGFMLQARDGSEGTVFRDNFVTARGANTIGPCGFSAGIQIRQGSGLIHGNVVRDYQFVGIFGTFGNVRVIGNSLRYYHASDNENVQAGLGIRIDHASGVILRNDVIGLPSAGSTTPRPQQGLGITNVTDDLVVRNNIVRRNTFGLELQSVTGALVVGNVLRNSVFDCLDDSTGGSGTDGTDNIWLDNIGDPAKSNPSGICSLP